MKEAEAKTKGCPVMQMIACSGSGCALWVWEKKKDISHTYGTPTVTELPKSQWEGRCGLVRGGKG